MKHLLRVFTGFLAISLALASCNIDDPGFSTGTVTDNEGQTYKTIKIGDQWWMAENLAVTKYRNGDPIPDGAGIGDYSNETDPEYYFDYDDNVNNGTTYGRLYTWNIINDNRNIAPEGWHVATDDEWEILANYISDDNGGYYYDGDDWEDVGTHLKSTNGWYNNENGTDDYGFNAIATGRRNEDGEFKYLGDYCYWWSATSYSSDEAMRYDLYFDETGLYRGNSTRKYGLAVRCVKDN